MRWIVFLVVMVIAVIVAMAVLRRATKDSMNAEDRRELAKLRALKNSIRVIAANHIVSDPLAMVILDEIAKVDTELERRTS